LEEITETSGLDLICHMVNLLDITLPKPHSPIGW
jgi:hypothetical protein